MDIAFTTSVLRSELTEQLRAPCAMARISLYHFGIAIFFDAGDIPMGGAVLNSGDGNRDRPRPPRIRKSGLLLYFGYNAEVYQPQAVRWRGGGL